MTGSVPQRTSGENDAGVGFPTIALLLTTVVTSAVLFGAWSLVNIGADLPPERYKIVVLGLLVSAVGHIVGTLVGALLAALRVDGAAKIGNTNSTMTAYLATMVVRFLCTPVLAVSLYFALPAEPKALLIGVAASYLVILVADSAILFTAMRASTRGSAGSRSTPLA